MTPRPTIVLPDRDELSRRLKTVDDSPDIVARLHSKFLSNAGKEVSGSGVAIGLALAVEEFRNDVQLPAAIANLVFRQLHDYARAIVDDPEALREALQVLDEAFPPRESRTS